MTRFWLSLEQAVNLVLQVAGEMRGGEIFVPKIPSMRVVDLARAMAPTAQIDEVGRRPGEKLHEVLLTAEEARNTLDLGSHYVIEPDHGSRREVSERSVADGFVYASDTNTEWMTIDALRQHVALLLGGAEAASGRTHELVPRFDRVAALGQPS
jgi:UDP-N-acetylglucosamine 4,6-dehydratase